MNGNVFTIPTAPSLNNSPLSIYGIPTSGMSANGGAGNPFLTGEVNPLDLYKTLLSQGFGGARAGGTSGQQGADQALRSQLFAPGSEYTDKGGALWKFDNTLTGSGTKETTTVNVSDTGAGGTNSQTYNTMGGIQNGDVNLWNPRNMPITPYTKMTRSAPAMSNSSLPPVPSI